MKIIALLCLPLVFLVGCTTAQYNYRAESKPISFPEVGKEITVNVGDEMVKQGIYSEIDALKVTQPVSIGTFGLFTINPGIYDKKGEDRKNEFYMPSASPDGGSVEKAALADPWQSVVYTKDGKKIGIVTIFNVAAKEPAQGVTKVKRPTLAENSFQQTLIYSGKVGNKIRLGYREFSNNLARPAFNNDVDYDLNESKVIGYKGARVEIINATNHSITYRVLQNFNAAK